MDKKYELNPDLKAILDEGKTSTFSLTNLFDSTDFNQEEEEDNLNGNDEVDYEASTSRKRSYESDNENDEADKDNHDELNDIKAKSRNHQEYVLNLAREEKFFFEKDDVRFERLKFYDPDRIEKHREEWNTKKILLRQAINKRRKLVKKKELLKAKLTEKYQNKSAKAKDQQKANSKKDVTTN